MSKEIFDQVQQMLSEVEAFTTDNKDALEQYRIQYIGSKGSVKKILGEFRNIEPARKKEFGQAVNALKKAAEDKYQALKDALDNAVDTDIDVPDLSMPTNDRTIGSRHPISIVGDQINDIFNRIGFTIVEGPEIEDDWHNFTALNTPADHPARDMQDTFYVKKEPAMMLRTHTSPVQVRTMMNNEPPIRVISPGRVYRNETISARAHCQFHQVEGLYIAENVSFADMKQTLLYFAKEMFGEDTELQLRPSFFPFTEPSAEMDITCLICKGDGCSVCKYTGWVEIMGCGMVDPNVLRNCNIDPEKYTGFAFGIGIERTAMLKYGLNDLRLFFENDVRFLRQFSTEV